MGVGTYRFLGNKRHILAVFLNVELADIIIIHQNGTGDWVIETFNHLNDCTLATAGSTDECDVGSRCNSEIEVPQDANGGTSGITEVNVLELDMALYFGDDLSFGRRSVDFWNRIEEVDNL